MEVVGRWLWLWHIQLSAPKFVLSIFVLYLILGSRCSARTHFSVSPPSSSSLPASRGNHVTVFHQRNENGNDNVLTSVLRWLKNRCSSSTFSFPIQRPDAEVGLLQSDRAIRLERS